MLVVIVVQIIYHNDIINIYSQVDFLFFFFFFSPPNLDFILPQLLFSSIAFTQVELVVKLWCAFSLTSKRCCRRVSMVGEGRSAMLLWLFQLNLGQFWSQWFCFEAFMHCGSSSGLRGAVSL